jgi:PTH1 family peptidyl-tRNA hydrolase
MDARMRLIVGLGNPGPEYAWTPHNLGFMVVDLLAERHKIKFGRFSQLFPRSLRTLLRNPRFDVGDGVIAGCEVILVKPLTYMNLSGLALREISSWYHFFPTDLIVVVDDISLPWGTIRIRERGSAGGHNGLKSIIGALGSDQFARVRLGAAPDHPLMNKSGYVLRSLRKAESKLAAEMVETATQAIEVILTDGVGLAMTRFNRRVKPLEEPES